MINIYAPFLDQLIESVRYSPVVNDKRNADALLCIFKEMTNFEVQGDDELRSIWIEASRGKINDFGSYKEYLEDEVVSSYKEFTELWKSYYPDKTKWYEFSVASYKKEYFFYIDSKLTFHIETTKGLNAKKYPKNKLIEWLYYSVIETNKKIKLNTARYNEYIKNNLPFSKRFGRILRSDYWKIFPGDKLFLQKGLSKKSLALLKKIVKQSACDKKDLTLKKITACDFFDFCKIAYEAIGYLSNEKDKLSPKEMYLKFADGRDCGLRKINEDSENEFLKWLLTESNCGGHPWEICRGGNSTHISMYVEKLENGCFLRLDGSSRARANETSKIAIALYKKQIPFMIERSEEIYRMVSGEDFIGIVPENIVPVYCHSYFPSEDKINDFMNLGFECKKEIIKSSQWYPVYEIKLRK